MAKILVADDSITDLKFVHSVIEGTGHEIITAMDGEDAEQKARSEKVNLIILDVIMPKKNGFQVCRSLKQDAATKSIPIILLTSKGQESDKFWGEKQGADAYLIKPCQPTDLMDAVTKFLK